MGQETLAKKLLEQLILQAPEWRETLRQAAASRNGEQIRFLCHTIRGAAATLQARRLEDAATHLGALVRDYQNSELDPAAQETMAAIEEATAYARVYLN